MPNKNKQNTKIILLLITNYGLQIKQILLFDYFRIFVLNIYMYKYILIGHIIFNFLSLNRKTV